MPLTIFYSWQDDLPRKTNRTFIEEAIEKALQKLDADTELEAVLREESLALDKDTRGIAGAPPIVETIFKKISAAVIFVPDLSFVATADASERRVPNPNVLIEYGWALRALSHSQVVAVMNTAFGEPTERSMPFNIRHLRWPIKYSLAEHADAHERKRVKDKLVTDLVAAFKIILERGEVAALIPQPPPFPEIQPLDRPYAFFREEEVLAEAPSARFDEKDVPLRVYRRGARMFLRLVPTKQPLGLNSKRALELAQQGRLLPLRSLGISGGEFYRRNSYGAIVFADYQDHSSFRRLCLTQLHKNGELWGINTSPVAWHHERYGRFLPNGYEATFLHALENYRSFMRDTLEIEPPLKIYVGFTDIESYKIAAPYGMEFQLFEKNSSNKIYERDILFEAMLNSYSDPLDEVLRPFFEKIWDECGMKRPNVRN